ncbi:MAG: nucleoid-structuring protein H-NS [Lentisphaerae bacterium RIFOXYA12_FULL_48_11]|nr:MAG: nucleoid-structuring protein H-NS [Lentisphaerae bacterium RIFOXYA12_FULL_48_11]
MSNTKETPQLKTGKGGWVHYRPEIKLLDCTIRDGGLINDHKFDDKLVKNVFDTCVAAGVDYIEFGYKGSKKIFAQNKFGSWKFCDEDDLKRIIGKKPAKTKIAVMADADRTDYHEDILPKDKSMIDCVRVACYIHQIPLAMDMIKDAHDKGYETLLQLMAISNINEHDLVEALEIAAKCPAAGVYIVDSFGSLYSEQVRDLTKIFLRVLDGTGKDVGFHAHNNQQLAFSNTLEALITGANRLDATINGIGRGAGNCPLELLIGFLHNPKFKIRPVLECCRDVFAPLSKQMDWGYSIPYALTGQMNQHPRAAIKMRASDKPDDYVGFYDQLMQEES